MGKPEATPTIPSAASVAGFQGITQSQSDGWFPPDVNGVVGNGFNVLTTNDRFVVYTKAVAPVVKKNVTLNTFFSYSAQAFFDPRVVYDSVWKRFVTEAEAFEESGTVQILGLSITKGGSPTGGTWNYLINGKQLCGNDVFVDYPQISTTQDAVLETVNCFRNSDGAYLGSRSFAVPKSILYNGLGFSVPVFSPGNATATPPNVLDGNPRAHLLVTGGGTAGTQRHLDGSAERVLLHDGCAGEHHRVRDREAAAQRAPGRLLDHELPDRHERWSVRVPFDAGQRRLVERHDIRSRRRH